jgi:histidyl-tRNA synthetase
MREAVQAEAEVIGMAAQALRRLGLLRFVVLEINSLGDGASRAAYVSALKTFLQTHENLLSEDSRARLQRGNVLRILDSKEEPDQALLRGLPLLGEDASSSSFVARPAAPVLGDYLTAESRSRFEALQESLRAAGVRFELNPFLVRGLDYYAHACFEFRMDLGAIQERLAQLPASQRGSVPAQATVLAGGRYDELFKTLGGPVVPAVGWAAGVDRLLLLSDLVQPEERHHVALPGPAPIGILLDSKGEIAVAAASPTSQAAPSSSSSSAASVGDATADMAQSVATSATAATTHSAVTLEQAHAALCNFVRDGCVLPSTDAAHGPLLGQCLHTPLYNVVQSFHPNVWKQLKAVTKSAADSAAAASGASSTSSSSSASSPGNRSMAAVLILGPAELAANTVQFRDQQTRAQSAVKLADLRARLQQAAGAATAATTQNLHATDASASAEPPLTFEQLVRAYSSF